LKNEFLFMRKQIRNGTRKGTTPASQQMAEHKEESLPSGAPVSTRPVICFDAAT
jgi:hypothetical protein